MAEFAKNIWAPWRMAYIGTIEQLNAEGCFLCKYWQQPQQDEQNLVLWRTANCIVVLNRFPYTSGHLLIAPAQHVGNLAELPPDLLADLMRLTQDAVKLLTETVHAHGFNVGLNLGRCAGAGLPEHIHLHVVPRWEGDTNFVPVLSDARVIPESLANLYSSAVAASDQTRAAKPIETPVDHVVKAALSIVGR